MKYTASCNVPTGALVVVGGAVDAGLVVTTVTVGWVVTTVELDADVVVGGVVSSVPGELLAEELVVVDESPFAHSATMLAADTAAANMAVRRLFIVLETFAACGHLRGGARRAVEPMVTILTVMGAGCAL